MPSLGQNFCSIKETKQWFQYAIRPWICLVSATSEFLQKSLPWCWHATDQCSTVYLYRWNCEAYVKAEYSGLQHSLPFLVVQEGTSALFGWNWLMDKKLLLVALLVHDTWCLIAKKVPWLNRLVILPCRCFCRSVLLALCWFSCLQNHVWIFLLLFISLFTKSVKKLMLSTLEAFWWAHWHVHGKCTSRVNIMPFSHAIFHQLYVDWDMHLVRK